MKRFNEFPVFNSNITITSKWELEQGFCFLTVAIHDGYDENPLCSKRINTGIREKDINVFESIDTQCNIILRNAIQDLIGSFLVSTYFA